MYKDASNNLPLLMGLGIFVVFSNRTLCRKPRIATWLEGCWCVRRRQNNPGKKVAKRIFANKVIFLNGVKVYLIKDGVRHDVFSIPSLSRSKMV